MKALQCLCWPRWWVLPLCVTVTIVGYIAVFPRERTTSAFTAGLEAMGERDIPAAIPKLEEALQSTEDPAERAKINLLLGLAYMWNDQLDKAIAAYEAVMTFDPHLTVSFPDQKMHHLNPMGMLADCHRMKALEGGESASAAWASALQWAQKCLEQNPDAEVMMLIVEEARGRLIEAYLPGSLPAAVIVDRIHFSGWIEKSNNRLLVPARDLGRMLGARVKWNPSTGQLQVAARGLKLVLAPGAARAVLNGRPVPLPVAPVMAGGQLLVPLRFVAETFGREVIWEGPPRIAWVR